MNKSVIIFFIFLLACMSCTKEPLGYKLYYFPFAEFNTPKVYCYENIRDKQDKCYYGLKSISSQGSSYLHIEIYDSEFKQTESIRLSINNQGAFANEYVFSYDSLKVPMKIYADTAMIWEPNDASKFLFEASHNRPDSRNQQIVKKVRNYSGKTGNFIFKNINYKTVELKEDVFINDGNDKLTLFNITQNFARNLGLVSFEVQQTGSPTKSYILTEIMNFNEWKNLQSSE
ncbi:MAG: hypothetical protein RBT61_09565, partial [Candidatus Kapabacteria bacterium]|nr:hypothetical protein [Candidatus Kapabacteria bacterium]